MSIILIFLDLYQNRKIDNVVCCIYKWRVLSYSDRTYVSKDSINADSIALGDLQALQRSISWNNIWQMAPLKLSFLIHSTYDQLPSKSNLVKWKKESDPTCSLCNEKPQTLEHVISSCKTALANRRYTWRHNSVLDKLVKIIQKLMMPESNKSTQKFVTEGGKIYVSSKKSTYHRAIPGQNLLGLDDNWKVSAGWCNDYPKIISNKGLWPDIVLFFKGEVKTSKYEDLKKELEKGGYSVTVKAVEIGARGYIAGTLYQFLGQMESIGIIGAKVWNALQK